MPFGLTNVPVLFQALINDTLWEYLDDFYTAYLDEILVYSNTLEKHQQHIQKVLENLKRAHLQVELEKSEFYKETIEFLGFVISPWGIEMESLKV